MNDPAPKVLASPLPRVGWWVGLTVAAWHLCFFASGAVTLTLASSPSGGVFEGLAEPVHRELLFASHLQVLAGYLVVALGAWILAYPIVRLWVGSAPVSRWGLVGRTLVVLGVLMAHGWLRLAHTQPYFLGPGTYDTWYFQAIQQWPEDLKARVFFVLFWFLPAVVLVSAAGVYVVETARWFREGGKWARCALGAVAAAAVLGAGWWVAPHFIQTARHPSDKRLNVLLLTADALRPPAGLGGHGVSEQPNVDALAADSLILSNMHSPLPSSLGESVTLHTGQAPHTHGLQTPLPSQGQVDAALSHSPLLPALLGAHGYSTAVMGDEAAGPIALANGLGFGEVEAGIPGAYPRHLAGLVYPAHFIIPAWLDNRLGRRLLPDLMVLPDRVSDAVVTDRLTRRLEAEAQEGTPFFLHGVYSEDTGSPSSPTAPAAAGVRDQNFDTHLGRLLECLEETGLRDNTVLVLLGRSRPSETPKADSSRTPAIPTGPLPVVLHIPGGTYGAGQINQLARLYDLAPTLLDVLGLPAEPAMEGVSLVPCFADRDLKLPIVVYGESPGFPDRFPSPSSGELARADFVHAVRLDPASGYRLVLNDPRTATRQKTRWVRTSHWQLVFTPAAASSEGVDQWQLFDLRSDPGTTRDIKIQNPNVWQPLELALRRWADQREKSELGEIFPQGEPAAILLPGT